jgi:hypothetical protein
MRSIWRVTSTTRRLCRPSAWPLRIGSGGESGEEGVKSRLQVHSSGR